MMKSKTNMSLCARGHAGTIQPKLIKVIIVGILIYSIMPVYGAIPWLHVDGNEIKDPAGNVVVLRGVSLIDLGFLEGWQGGAINMINRLADKNDTQGSSPGWYTKTIRIPIVPPEESSGWPYRWTPGNDNFYNNLLRPVVDYCAQKDVYAIIDWHYITDTWSKVSQTSEFWEYMAPRFASDSHVMFELFNEPINNVGTDTQDWLSVRTDMQTWINIVRTYAPDNLILVGGPQWCQILAPQISYPVDGNNIVYVAHIYPAHWCGPWTVDVSKIADCAAVHPVIMTEWGFSMSMGEDTLLNGTITEYGQPLMDFLELHGISNTAWVASYDWGPPMFWRPSYPLPPGTWDLRIGEGEMGGFTKDKLYEKKNDDLPGLGFIDFGDFADFATQWRRTDCGPSNTWCNDADSNHDGSVGLNDLQELVYYWLGGAD